MFIRCKRPVGYPQYSSAIHRTRRPYSIYEGFKVHDYDVMKGSSRHFRQQTRAYSR